MADQETPVEVTLTIAARPATIFRYFTDPDRFARWMGRGVRARPRARRPPAGRLPDRAGRRRPGGGRRARPASWGYEGDGQAVPAGSSTVEITPEPVDGGTEVRLRHSGLPAGEPPLAHLAGWRHAMATFAYAGSADQLAPVLGERVADWLAAWTSPTRTAGRSCWRCLAADGRFRWLHGFWDPPTERP